ncbi:MAG: polysaccharide deacetylase family protein [Thiobacillaceae bacterium]
MDDLVKGGTMGNFLNRPRAEQRLSLITFKSMQRFTLSMAILALLLLPRTSAALQIPILVYHRFGPQATDSMTVPTDAFEAQLRQIKDAGYRVIPLRQLVYYLVAHAPPPPDRSVVITVDDGHRSVYTELLPRVRRLHMPVTLFIYPSAISNASYAMTWAQLAELRASGLFDIQSHTYWHPNFFRERKRLDPETYTRFVDTQLTRSKAELEQRLGERVDMLAWPFGLQDAGLRARAARAGYIAAFTLERRPARSDDDALALPRYLITDSVSPAAFAAILRQADGAPADRKP